MAKFKVDARAMLTWGRESIKDHTTAVLELVKNSYDAGAAVTDVTIISSGKGQLSNRIIIADNGCGMTADDLESSWLRIGYSQKRDMKTIDGRRKTGEKGIGRISADRLGRVLTLKTQARQTDSVGLEVDWDDFIHRNKELGQIEIKELVRPTFEVPLPSSDAFPAGDRRSNSRTRPGTELVITGLRQVWTTTDIQELRAELSQLTPPFNKQTGFELRLTNDILPELNGIIQSEYHDLPEIKMEIRYDGEELISYDISTRDDAGRLRLTESQKVAARQFVHGALPEIAKTKALVVVPLDSRAGTITKRTKKPVKETATDQALPMSCGPVHAVLEFYPNKADTLRGSGFTRGQLREYVKRHAGVRIYRDSILVKPYGVPETLEWDWLGLGDRKVRDPAGAGRKSFKFSPSQIIGAAFITRDGNADIADSSAREGLIEGPAYCDLKLLLQNSLRTMALAYHKIYIQKPRSPSGDNHREVVAALAEDLRDLETDLRAVEAELPASGSLSVRRIGKNVSAIVARIAAAATSIDELANQATIYRTLATLGIASASFGHETASSMNGFLAATRTAEALIIKQRPIKLALEELKSAIRFGEDAAAWGTFALTRVRTDKRERQAVHIDACVRAVILQMKPLFDFREIELDYETHLQSVIGKLIPMDIESVAINLLSNAYEFSRRGRRDRVVRVEVLERIRRDLRGVELIVADSGPGVARNLQEAIWAPLFTTRAATKTQAAGTGLGLAIVQSVLDDNRGERAVDTDPKLGGARFTIWLPLTK